MTITQTELFPQLARLFHIAGLLEEADWQGCRPAKDGEVDPKHKPILDVLGQDVSLGTFKDLLYADILTLRSRRRESSSGLHEGLTATGMVTDEELRALLVACRPPARELLAALTASDQLDPVAAQQFIDRMPEHDPAIYDELLAQGLLSASLVCQWLSHLEAPPMRQTALYLAVYILHHNSQLADEPFRALLDQLRAGQIDEARARVQSELGLGSGRLRELLETRLTLPHAAPGREPDPGLLARFPQSFIRRQAMLPFALSGKLPLAGQAMFGVATSDPLNIPLAALLYWVTGAWPCPHIAADGPLMEKINGGRAGAAPPPVTPKGKAASGAKPAVAAQPAVASQPLTSPERLTKPTRYESEAPASTVTAVQLVSTLIEDATELRTTDIHLEPERQGLNVRFRIDGELHKVMTIPAALAQPVVSRVKVLAGMDVTERRRPQDGHFELSVGQHNFDFRISTLPAMLGEKIVIRILDEARVLTGLDHLGLLPRQRQLFEGMIAQPHGMILVTGPTGSGKTSTLYAGLCMLKSENRNLVTIEDPVEYQLDGITQVQVDPHIGLGFTEGLRSILRQDPDVIMVGEIRDGDTAHIAIRAALTGHLVFSTLHTNTALGAVDALIHLGAVPFMVASAISGILSQRLVRCLCPACRKPRQTNPQTSLQLGLAENARKRIWQAAGCGECLGSGYAGRNGVFEVIRLNEAMRPLITRHNLTELEQAVREQGMIGLAEAGIQKVLDGVTSLEEMTRKVMVES